MQKKRDPALDAFRGLTMMFMLVVNNPGSWSHIYSPLRHAAWHGWTPTDFVFPFFLFAVGAGLAVGFAGGKEPGLSKVFRRSLILFALGVILNAYPFQLFGLPAVSPSPATEGSGSLWQAFLTSWAEVRIFGVLQRIALCYLIAALSLKLFLSVRRKYLLRFPRKTILIAAGFVLFATTVLLFELAMHSASGGGWASYSREDNAAARLDRWLIPTEHMYRTGKMGFDPEGILSTLGGLASTISGFLFYIFFQQTQKKMQVLLAALFTVLTGYLLHAWQIEPVNKLLWTPAYVFFTSGWAALLYAGLDGIYQIPFNFQALQKTVHYIQSAGVEKALKVAKAGNSLRDVATAGLSPAVAVGRNAILIYLLSGLLGQTLIGIGAVDNGKVMSAKGYIFAFFQQFMGNHLASLTYALLFVVLFSSLAFVLDKNKITVHIG